jgi:hypothetical protein
VTSGSVVAAVGDGLLCLAVTRWGIGGPLAAPLPGLFLVGAGQGLCITPLTTTVLSHAGPATAGAVSGALSTMQEVGGSRSPSSDQFVQRSRTAATTFAT